MKRAILITLALFVLTAANDVFAGGLLLRLGPEELVQAAGGDIAVLGYSVPSFVDWDNDGDNDLVIGEGPSSSTGKVRVYLNAGTASNPQFSGFTYVQSNGSDLACPGSGCLGCFPRVVYWNGDEKKDLLIGQADGKVKVFLNIGTDQNPTFDTGTFVQVGPLGSKGSITVGARATPSAVDWNGDGKKDLVVGALDGKIHLFINEGTDAVPDFRAQTFAQASGSDLIVPTTRSSPVVTDLNGDGEKDILTGNTEGQLLFYTNTGTDAEPNFAGYEFVESDGVPIDLGDANDVRSRPFVCDWDGDGYLDVLIGAKVNPGTGFVHLYRSVPQAGDFDNDYDVDFDDFAVFALYYGFTGCGPCGGADLAGDDGIVDMRDVLEFADWWLTGTE
jgi:hypothetical protein